MQSKPTDVSIEEGVELLELSVKFNLCSFILPIFGYFFPGIPMNQLRVIGNIRIAGMMFTSQDSNQDVSSTCLVHSARLPGEASMIEPPLLS